MAIVHRFSDNGQPSVFIAGEGKNELVVSSAFFNTTFWVASHDEDGVNYHNLSRSDAVQLRNTLNEWLEYQPESE